MCRFKVFVYHVDLNLIHLGLPWQYRSYRTLVKALLAEYISEVFCRNVYPWIALPSSPSSAVNCALSDHFKFKGFHSVLFLVLFSSDLSRNIFKTFFYSPTGFYAFRNSGDCVGAAGGGDGSCGAGGGGGSGGGVVGWCATVVCDSRGRRISETKTSPLRNSWLTRKTNSKRRRRISRRKKIYL